MEGISSSIHTSAAPESAAPANPADASAANTLQSTTLASPEGVARRSAVTTPGSPRQPHDDVALKRAREHSPEKVESGWPESRVDTANFEGPSGSVENQKRPHRETLQTEGRALPELTPQSLGHYFQKAEGNWPSKRERLAAAVTVNIMALAGLKDEAKVKQLRREVTLHWHSLSDAEKSDVLETIGQESRVPGQSKWSGPAAHPNVKAWLDHTAAHMEPGKVTELLDACTEKARGSLHASFETAGTDLARKAEVKAASKDMRMTLPLDHMYDYTGFYWGNNRKVGHLPKDVAEKLRVCVIGAGPAGVMAADALNRIGVKPTVLEAEDHIGGRLATHYRERDDGTQSPTATHPGGMRFHTTHGNFYWSFAEHYKLPFIDFPNPSRVGATLVLDDRVMTMAPGSAPAGEHGEHDEDTAVLEKVRTDFKVAMNSLMKPIRDARDAGDTAKFRELCEKMKKDYDPLDFEDAVKDLLAKNHIEWTPKHWETFGAVGMGVGGYKGYYSTGSLEEFRFEADERLEDHKMIVDGADEPLRQMVADRTGLPSGTQSLAEQNAIRLNIPVTDIEKKDGKYHVTSNGPDGVKTEVYDEVFFGAGARVAVNLGMTRMKDGAEPLLSTEMAARVEQANIVGATKMTMTVPADEFNLDDLPKNVQSTAPFQQLYLQPPSKEGNSAVIYLSYTLGDNAKKVEGVSQQDQVRGLVTALREGAARNPEAKESRELVNLADLIDKYGGIHEGNENRVHYTHWTNVPTQEGAFKMDAPNDLENTRALFAETRKSTSGLHLINEEMTAEGGFASGPLAAAVNAVQNMVKRRGGTLPANSPLDQKTL